MQNTSNMKLFKDLKTLSDLTNNAIKATQQGDFLAVNTYTLEIQATSKTIRGGF